MIRLTDSRGPVLRLGGMTREPRVPAGRSRTALLLAAAVAGGCEPFTDSGDGPYQASLAMAPVLAPGLASFAGTLVDAARVRVVRPTTGGPQVIVDTIAPFPATSTQITLRLLVPLRARTEKLLVRIDLLAAKVPLLGGEEVVDVYALGFGPAATPRPVLSYIGPGGTATTLVIEPRDTVLTFGSTFTFRPQAFDQNNTPVTTLLLLWTSSDPTVPVTQTGQVVAPPARSTVWVRAETPTSLMDSTRVRIAPPPALVSLLGGDNQTALAGALLQAPLAVRVLASDGLGVPGVVVRFRPVAGLGTVNSAVVVTDDAGDASTLVRLGAVPGVYTFEAVVAGFLPVLFTALAL